MSTPSTDLLPATVKPPISAVNGDLYIPAEQRFSTGTSLFLTILRLTVANVPRADVQRRNMINYVGTIMIKENLTTLATYVPA